MRSEIDDRLKDKQVDIGTPELRNHERVMTVVDNLRREELYPHEPEDCNDECKKKGYYYNLNIEVQKK